MIGLALAMLASGAATDDWPKYVNARFGYAVCYPHGAMKPQPESDAGDGRLFAGPEGGTFRVYGTNVLNAGALEAERRDVLNDLASHKGRATYQASGKNWIVVSGVSRAGSLYERATVRSGQLVVARFEYPSSASPRYSRLITSMMACFKAGRPPY